MTIKDDLRRYRKELTKIEPRYLALKELVANLEKLHSLDTAKDSEVDIDSLDVSEEAFSNLTTKDAALKGLYIIGEPVKAGVLADFLETHGFQHESKNFANTVNTALDRLAHNALVEKVPNKGWKITAKGAADCQTRLLDPLSSFLNFAPSA